MRSRIAAIRRARQRRRGSPRRTALTACLAAAGLAVTVAACGARPDGPGSDGPPQGPSTVTYALAPGAYADYILPFDDSDNYSVYNVNDFQYLLYRPLYWFGKGTGPLLNTGLSLAYLPEYSGQVVKIRLKPGWSWSNGQPVDAQDVVFWMQMMIANKTTWAGYVPGYFPDNVKDIHAVGKYEVEMTIKGPYSQPWFTDNELSQITPLPLAWDVTSSGPSNCVNVLSDCVAVYSYLAKLAGQPQTYGSSPIWNVVDGPWRVQSLTSQHVLTLVTNPKYSAKLPAHHITKFIEEPFTSEQAEYNVLQDPTASQAVDVGYLPTVDAPPSTTSGTGPNPATVTDYNLSVQYAWSLTYFPYNFQNKTGQGPIMGQLYFRQAFQDLVDQEGTIDGPLHGYGKVTIGPVGNYPVTKYLSPTLESKGDQWPLSLTNAKSLLSSHGWSIKPGGTDACLRGGAGGCGAGIATGTKLSLSLIWATGVDWMESAVKELASNASQVGINLSVTGTSFQNVINIAFGSCGPGQPCSWDMAFWGSWTYAPDYVPTGEELFIPGAINNAGGYDSATNNRLTTASLHAGTPAAFYKALYKWQDYLAGQLPVVWEPDAPGLIETFKGLHTGPWNSALDITPEDWYWQK
jgi:peptide/nickel transport system substrate-binding protein